MLRMLRFAIAVLILYVIWDQAMPWVQQQMGTDLPDASVEGPGRCVRLGDRANDSFGERVGRVSGLGGDAGAWEQFVGDISGLIGDARSGCRCQELSCEKVQRAMVDLEDMIDQLDVRFRGGQVRGNPAQRQIGINELLNEARNLARQGN